ncbi:MAG: nucleotide exchange factor GrpE [Clostridiales bacterium]|nr:nucleotide exchange factor GrpE [Clostridiales bacterium]
MSVWSEGLSLFFSMAMEQVSDFAATIQAGALDRVILAATSQAKGFSSDEKIYECLERMSRCVKEASSICKAERESFGTFSLKGILDSLNEALESKEIAFAGFEREGFSPVSAELTRIIGEKTQSFVAWFQTEKRRLMQEEAMMLVSELRREAALDPGKALSDEGFKRFVQALSRLVCESFIPGSMEASRACVEDCVACLNAPGGRKEAEAFRELLASEKAAAPDILGKLSALESEIKRNAGNSREQAAAKRLYSVLREGMECLLAQAAAIDEDIAREESVWHPLKDENPTDYEIAIQNILANRVLVSKPKYFEGAKALPAAAAKARAKIGAQLPYFIDRVEMAATAKLTKDPFKCGREFLSQSMFDLIQEEKVMAQEVTDVFKRQISFYQERAAEYESIPESDIVKGINETLLIKVEGLAENLAAFEEKAKGIAERAKSVAMSFGKEEEEAMEREIGDQFFRLFTPVPESADALLSTMSIFYKNLAESPAAQGPAGRLAGDHQKHTGYLAKAIYAFRKEVLLFEVSTFEEILQYSVSRLKESTSEAAIAFAQGMDEGTKEIEAILLRRGIKAIKPSPHDMFNGREHEVLVVEKSEGFSKGEIIKLMSSGYKQDQSVLMRANVIAAR